MLSDVLSDRSTTQERAFTLLSSAYQATAFLHRAKHVHRDVKPQNSVLKPMYGDDGPMAATDEVGLIDLGPTVRDGTPWNPLRKRE